MISSLIHEIPQLFFWIFSLEERTDIFCISFDTLEERLLVSHHQDDDLLLRLFYYFETRWMCQCASTKCYDAVFVFISHESFESSGFEMTKVSDSTTLDNLIYLAIDSLFHESVSIHEFFL